VCGRWDGGRGLSQSRPGIAAIAVVASQAGGPAARPGPVTLTAAMVQHVRTASGSALTQSGEADISYRNWEDGVAINYGTTGITFDGAHLAEDVNT